MKAFSLLRKAPSCQYAGAGPDMKAPPAGGILLILLLLPLVFAVDESPPVPPAAFYGSASINGASAPAGTVITARLDGIQRGSFTISEAGKYGGLDGREAKLFVSGTDKDRGKTVYFYINGVEAGTAQWNDGAVYNLNLAATISSPPPSGGSPPSGTSVTVAVVSPPKNESKQPVTVTETAEIKEGETRAIQFAEGTVSEIRVTLTNSIAGLSLQVNKLDSKPAEVPPAPGTVYGYLSIEKNVVDSDIQSATISFKVEKAWVEANLIEPDTIALNRYTTEWTKLTTRLIGDDSAYYYFEADSPGFSIFAITGLHSEPVKSCPQQRTLAKSPAGECVEYPSECDVPAGWVKVDSCLDKEVPETAVAASAPTGFALLSPATLKFGTAALGILLVVAVILSVRKYAAKPKSLKRHK